VRLDLPWDASCQTGVVNAVGEIRQRVDASLAAHLLQQHTIGLERHGWATAPLLRL
jgi:hypothetical protein